MAMNNGNRTGSRSAARVVGIVCVGLVAVVWLFWPAGGSSHADHELDSEFVNRIWIDRLPKANTDKISVLVLIDDPQLGVFEKTSAYEGDFSLFEWRAEDGGKLRIFMLQNEKKHKARYRVSNRDCGRFDLCVKVKGAPRGPKNYYSMKDWVVAGEGPGGPDSRALRAALREKVFEAR